MAFDFDEVIERRGTHCSKVDMLEARFGITDRDVIAMTVADMDFRSPPAVNEALHRLADDGVHGYFGDAREMNAGGDRLAGDAARLDARTGLDRHLARGWSRPSASASRRLPSRIRASSSSRPSTTCSATSSAPPAAS